MIKVIELPVPGNNFIMVFKTDRLDICDRLINMWEISEKQTGKIYTSGPTNKDQKINTGVDLSKDSIELVKDISIKDSLDVCIPYNEHSKEIYKEYCDHILQPCVEEYILKYPFCNIGAAWYTKEQANIQKYGPGGGFKTWHSERMNQTPIVSKRHLVFMTYLNDVFDTSEYDGGTEWAHQNVKLKARKGHTVIWPADWTHVHRGIVAPNKEKYIITGWFSFVD